jgi:hypothetical protein
MRAITGRFHSFGVVSAEDAVHDGAVLERVPLVGGIAVRHRVTH